MDDVRCEREPGTLDAVDRSETGAISKIPSARSVRRHTRARERPAMPPLLTPDAINNVLAGAVTSREVKPLVQVFDKKPIKTREGEPRRFRLLVSDGSFAGQALVAGELNDMCAREEISKFTILRLDEYTVQVVNDKTCVCD